jgi:hypothetical protein
MPRGQGGPFRRWVLARTSPSRGPVICLELVRAGFEWLYDVRRRHNQNGCEEVAPCLRTIYSWEGRIGEGAEAMTRETDTYCVCPNCGAVALIGRSRCDECGHATVQKTKRVIEHATTRVFRL